MYKTLALLALIFPSSAFANECYIERPMEDVVENSRVIFYGEVIGVEMVGKFVESGKYQKYKVTVRPQKVLKGKPYRKYVFMALSFYYDQDLQESKGLVFSGDGNRDLELGEKYMILIEKGKDITWSPWCSEHILPIESDRYEYFVNEIQEKL